MVCTGQGIHHAAGSCEVKQHDVGSGPTDRYRVATLCCEWRPWLRHDPYEIHIDPYYFHWAARGREREVGAKRPVVQRVIRIFNCCQPTYSVLGTKVPREVPQSRRITDGGLTGLWRGDTDRYYRKVLPEGTYVRRPTHLPT